MVNLSCLNEYIETNCDSYFLNEAIGSMKRNGFNYWIDRQINAWCNCSILTPDGRRLLQTNDKRYSREITICVKMIEEYGGDDKDYYYNKLINRHFNNLEFERINGYAYDPYSTTKKKSTTSKKKTKQTSLDFGNKPKKETAAEKKLKAHATKISMLTFKIKPANGNNTL